jgi:hypothetical protein
VLIFAACLCGGVSYYALCHLGCACLYTCTYRTKLRALYSLPEDPCGDCCVHFWCTACALCQEYRELNNRGLDPRIGLFFSSLFVFIIWILTYSNTCYNLIVIFAQLHVFNNNSPLFVLTLFFFFTLDVIQVG